MTLTEFVNGLYAELRSRFPEDDRVEMTQDELSGLLARFFECLKELRLFIRKNPFTDADEEIQFFKEIKPMFIAELIYYAGLFRLKARMPQQSLIRKKNFLLAEMEKLSSLFVREEQLYDYWCTGDTKLDRNWFCRGSGFCPAEFFEDLAGINRDIDFSSAKDHLIAAFMAYERLFTFCEAELQDAQSDGGGRNVPRKLPWTDSKASLIELAYALQARGALAGGKAEIKQIIELLEYAFDIDLGNYYGVFTQNIRLRKKNRTAFLDQLKEYLERRMDDLDE